MNCIEFLKKGYNFAIIGSWIFELCAWFIQ